MPFVAIFATLDDFYLYRSCVNKNNLNVFALL